jgi:hypothetical protein
VGEYNKLSWCGIDAWLATFRSLSRMHAAYFGRNKDLRALGSLGEHRPTFYYRFFARTVRAAPREGALATFPRQTAQRPGRSSTAAKTFGAQRLSTWRNPESFAIVLPAKGRKSTSEIAAGA